MNLDRSHLRGQSFIASALGACHKIVQIDTDQFLAACPPDPGMKLNADCTVAVSTDVFWNEDMSACPRGCKVQLLGEGGVALYGNYDGKDPFFKKWAPVPRNRPKV